MKLTKRALCLLLAAVMALALTIPVLAMDEPDVPEAALADTPEEPVEAAMDEPDDQPMPADVASERLITLKDGKNDVTFGTVTAVDGVLGELPAATRKGWIFQGWYASEITEELDISDPTDETSYWQWKITDHNDPVQSGSYIGEETDTLYARFEPTTVEYAMCFCGWNGRYGALYATREYGVPFTASSMDSANWEGYVFDGWWTSLDDSGIKLKTGTDEDVNGTPVGEFKEVYLHWHKADDPSVKQQYRYNPGFVVGTKIDTLSMTKSRSLHPGDSFTASISVTPAKADLTGIEWSCDSDIITVSPIDHGNNTNIYGPSNVEAVITAGSVPADSEESATVTVEVGGKKASMTVTVKHDRSVLVSSQAPTCQAPGWEQWKCASSHCDLPNENRTLDIVDHTYPKTLTVPATCTAEGYTTRTCSVCGLEDRTTIPAKAHHFGAPQTVVGCGETVTTQTCLDCGYTKTTTSEGTGNHNWDSEYTVDKDATCVDMGSESHHCTNAGCKITKDSRSIPATGKHTFGAWNEVKAATLYETGLNERTCTTCGATETEVIPKHSNIPGVRPGGGGGGGGAAPEVTPTPEASPTPEVTPTPAPEVTPTPAPAPVDPPKTNNGSGWVYDEETGADYYFINGEMKRDYWAADEGASRWNFWYYVDESGKLERGLQYIENPNGTGWYMLQVEDTNGCRGRLLDGVQQTDIAGKGMFVTTRGVNYGKCVWTQDWGYYNEATGLWSDGQSHR